MGGKPVSLTLREFDLLAYLMAHPGIVCTRDGLLKQVWGWDFDGGSRTVDVHVQTPAQQARGIERRDRDRAWRGLPPARIG